MAEKRTCSWGAECCVAQGFATCPGCDVEEDVPDDFRPDKFEMMGETGCECCELLSGRLRQTTVDLGAVLVALGFDEPAGLAGPWPTMGEVTQRIEDLQECKRTAAQRFDGMSLANDLNVAAANRLEGELDEAVEALVSCAEILSVPPDSSLATEVPHAVAELREQSDSRGLTILQLQSKR